MLCAPPNRDSKERPMFSRHPVIQIQASGRFPDSPGLTWDQASGVPGPRDSGLIKAAVFDRNEDPSVVDRPNGRTSRLDM
jgi:hypothetical protein